ncbi:MAG: RICIN domain-containing protein [Nannocystaceae bacterium]
MQSLSRSVTALALLVAASSTACDPETDEAFEDPEALSDSEGMVEALGGPDGLVADEDPAGYFSAAIPSHTDFSIAAITSGKCLDVPSSSTANNVLLQTFPCNSQLNQKFYWEPSSTFYSDGAVRIRARHSFKCLDVADGWLRQKDCHTGASQRFNLTTSWSPSSLWMQAPKYMAIRPTMVSNTCLDVPGFAQQNSFVQRHGCNNGPNQRWLFLIAPYED